MDQYTEGFIGIPPPTVLPDGSIFSDTIDLNRFTDSKHDKYNATLRIVNEVREGLGFELLEYFNPPPFSEFHSMFGEDMY